MLPASHPSQFLPLAEGGPRQLDGGAGRRGAESTDKAGLGVGPGGQEAAFCGHWAALGWSALLDLSLCSPSGLGGSHGCPLPDNSLGLSVSFSVCLLPIKV